MIVQVDPKLWSLEDLTGGGSWVENNSGEYTLITPMREDETIGILRSTDFGETWTELDSRPLSPGTLRSEPQIYDDSNYVWFITTKTGPDGSQTLFLSKVIKATWLFDDAANDIPIVTAREIRSEYSLTMLGSDLVCSVSAFQPTDFSFGHGVLLYKISSLGVVDTPIVIASSPFRSSTETTYVYPCNSCITQGSNVEVYWLQCPSVYSFIPRVSFIYVSVYDGTSVSSPTEVVGYTSEFNDDKFTVYKDSSNNSYLLHSKFTQSSTPGATKMVLQRRSAISLGYLPSAGYWSWSDITSGNPIEPTLSICGVGKTLCYLESALDGTGGFLRVWDWDPVLKTLTEKSLRTRAKKYKWLLGSKGPVESTSDWAVIGLSQDETGVSSSLVSGYNLPPVPVITTVSDTVQRGVWVYLDGSESFDPDLDDMTFTWELVVPNANIHLAPTLTESLEGLFIDKAIGPDALDFQVRLTIQDLDELGLPINSPVSVVRELHLPINLAPMVHWPSTIFNTGRVADFTLSPIVVDSESDSLIYSWTQTSGTTVPLSGEDTNECTFYLYEIGFSGEYLEFLVSVSDEISPAVETTIQLYIPPLNLSPYLNDVRIISESLRQNLSYETAGVGTINEDFLFTYPTDLTNLSSTKLWKSFVDPSEISWRVAISDRSVTMISSEDTEKKFFLPGQKKIIDATVSETGDVFILGQSAIYCFLRERGSSDCPDLYLSLSSYFEGKVLKEIGVSVSARGSRCLMVSTNSGLLMFQVVSPTVIYPTTPPTSFTNIGTYLLSGRNNLLYGSSDVQWFRWSGVESVNKGKILVGTRDSQGNPFESLVDLSKGKLLGCWDKSNLINQNAVTGEIIFNADATYFGVLDPPQLLPLSIVSGEILAVWTQTRPDLANGYLLEVSQDMGAWGDILLNSGAIRQYSIPGYQPTSSYRVRVRSFNEDGDSGWSVTETV